MHQRSLRNLPTLVWEPFSRLVKSDQIGVPTGGQIGQGRKHRPISAPGEKRKRPGLKLSHGTPVDQPSPESCSHTPYVLVSFRATTYRNRTLLPKGAARSRSEPHQSHHSKPLGAPETWTCVSNDLLGRRELMACRKDAFQ